MIQRLLEPLFQPIVDRDGRVFAYEALVRLRGHPFSPARLIQRWERTGYIVTLDMAMVRRVGEILASGRLRPRIALNVSIVTVEAAGDDYVRALADIAPYARLLIVELTETASITNAEAINRFYAACRGQGFAIALDDCKPGHLYAAPGFIEALRPQLVKIDGRELQDRHQDGDTTALVQLVRQAHAADAQVIAEFVSSSALHEFALQLGADFVQGFAIGVPGPLPTQNESVYTIPFSVAAS
jgi:EAL domain-containing protein (putative c-di-GMP-specific phosphodiesterase class I)